MSEPRPHRSWCFTWNNYPADVEDRLRAQADRFHMCAAGREVSASGTPHLQGVLISKKPLRLAALIKLFPGCHFEVMRGEEAEAVRYTHKGDAPPYSGIAGIHGPRIDWDTRQQGSRTDLAAVTALVQANPRLAVRRVAAEMPTSYVKYHQGIKALAHALQPVPPLRGAIPDVFWFYGPTGTGKSHTAIEEAVTRAGGDESNVFRWTIPNFKFPGNFTGEDYVVIDELRSTWEHFSFGRLLSILDRFRCETELKGSNLYWSPKAIWITTPLHPQDFVTDEERRGNPLCIGQLLRRIKEIREFSVFYVRPPSPAPAPDAICPDSTDEGQPGTPPLTRADFRPCPYAARSVPVATDVDTESDDAFRARMLRRRGAMRLPAPVESDDSELEVVNFAADE